MSTPVGPNPANPYGIGGGGSILSSYGVNIGGGAIAPSGGLGSGESVFMGTKKRKTLVKDIDKGKVLTLPATETVDDYMSVDEARALPALWAREDPKKLRDFINKGILAKVPGFDADMGLPEVLSIWDDMINLSVDLGKKGQKWSPYDIIDTYGDTVGNKGTKVENGWIIDLTTNKRIGYKGPLTKKTKRTEYNFTSPEEVQAIMNQALADALGRAPTEKELAQFRASVSSMEAGRPQVSEITTTVKPNLETGELEEVSSSSVNTGGVSQADIQQAASVQAKKSPEYGKYQSGTTYFDAMMQMIAGS